ncbi:MAG: Rieske 2Fe-2S domain-containing protein, partial [Bacteroidota bacterium]
LHLTAGMKSIKLGKFQKTLEQDGFVKVCHVNEIEADKAKMVLIDQEAIAIFKYENKLSAIHNFCKHQNGPLSEGKVIDGCITCPWHGYQYLPSNGQSPPPFTEKVKTYSVRYLDQHVWVHPTPHPEGTELEPAIIH